MSQTIDDRGRTAARELHSAVRAVDTEAALGRMPRRSARPAVRPFLLAAAAILLAGGLAVGLGAIGRSEPTESLNAAAQPADVPIDPDTYGPVVDSIVGVESPTLRADLHGPTLLKDGDQVAVAIEGGRPGMRYIVVQCTMTHDLAAGPEPCNFPGVSVVLDSEGRSTAALPARSEFNASPLEQSRQDCRPERCRLTIHPVYGDMNESPNSNVDKFASQNLDDGSRASEPVTATPASSLVLRFAPDAAAPVTPEITASYLGRSGDDLLVRLAGSGLRPGEFAISALAFEVNPSVEVDGGLIGHIDLPKIEVAPNGSFSAELSLPLTIEEEGYVEENGEQVGRGPARCLDPGFRCQITLRFPDENQGTADNILLPAPIQYPEAP